LCCLLLGYCFTRMPSHTHCAFPRCGLQQHFAGSKLSTKSLWLSLIFQILYLAKCLLALTPDEIAIIQKPWFSNPPLKKTWFLNHYISMYAYTNILLSPPRPDGRRNPLAAAKWAKPGHSPKTLILKPLTKKPMTPKAVY
jgi:hypothetical protein